MSINTSKMVFTSVSNLQKNIKTSFDKILVKINREENQYTHLSK